MSIYTDIKPEDSYIFESLKTHIVDESTLEPLMSEPCYGERNTMYGYVWGDRYPKPMLGKKHSEETKQKMSENNGRYWKGKTIPDEIKAKLSKAKQGKKLSNETKTKMSKSRIGKTKSDETKNKMSESAKLRWSKIRQSRQEEVGIDCLPNS